MPGFADFRARPPDLVLPRPRLFALLDTATPLTIVRAPTGFGKTVLVSEWLAATGSGYESRHTDARRTVWLRVPTGGGDQHTFWAGLVDAMRAAGIPADATGKWSAATRSVRALAEQLLATAGPLTLVVDSFENVTSDGLDAELIETVSATPALHLIVCLRSRRHFPAELTGRLQTTEITARHLRFTEDETAALVESAGLRAVVYRSGLLHANTGGWPELTRLVVARSTDAPSDPGHLARLAMDTAIGYLRRRLIPAVARREALDFPLFLSVPDEFTVALAGAIVDADATAVVSWLEAEGLLTSVERSGEVVFRWAVAARSALRAELAVRFPDRLPGLHSRVARWTLDHDLPAAALQHAMQAQDWPLLIEVMEKQWWTLQLTERDALIRAFAMAPWELIAASPRVAALRELVLPVPDSRVLAGTSLPTSASQLTQLGVTAQAADLIDNGLLTTVVLRHRGQFARAASYARRLLTLATAARSVQPGATARFFSAANLTAGRSLILSGDLGGAHHLLYTAYRTGADARERPAAASLLALDHALLGELPAAEHWLARFDDTAVERTDDDQESSIVAVTARLLTALDSLDFRAAHAAHRVLPPALPDSDLWAFLLYVHAQYALHLGDPLGMLDRLAREQSARRRLLGEDSIAAPLLAAAQVLLLLSAGRASQAHRVLEGMGPHPLLQVPAARLALMSGDFDEVERLAADRTWEHEASTRDRLDMLLVRASAQSAAGHRTTSQSSLRRAGDVARINGLARPFATVPVSDLIDDGTPAEALHYLRLAREHRQPFPRSVALVRLSTREHIVLQQISGGLTLEQTAERLVVSHNTVKTHVRNIYRKLGTGSREDAIGRARELGLVEPIRPAAVPQP